MALKKSVTLGGVTGEYWRIDRLDFQQQVKGGASFIYVSLHTNKAAAAPGAKGITLRQYMIPESVLSKKMLTAATPANPYTLMYTWLKTQPDFTGAIDA